MSAPEATPSAGTVLLRPPAEHDHQEMLRWRSDPETLLLIMSTHLAEGIDDVKAWIARRSGDPNGAFLVIASGAGDEAVGFVQLTRIHRRARHANLGLFVANRVRGTGIAAEALRLMEQRAAQAHGLRKIVLEVLASNRRAVRFWEKHGYRPVGTLKEHFLHGEAFHDVVLLEKMIGP